MTFYHHLHHHQNAATVPPVLPSSSPSPSASAPAPAITPHGPKATHIPSFYFPAALFPHFASFPPLLSSSPSAPSAAPATTPHGPKVTNTPNLSSSFVPVPSLRLLASTAINHTISFCSSSSSCFSCYSSWPKSDTHTPSFLAVVPVSLRLLLVSA